jgi:DNA repair protein RecO (recombination protein O)
MARQRKQNIDAFVLKSRNFKDADKMYALLTRESGKVMAMGRGVRKITSKRAGSLDTLNNVVVSYAESSAGFKNITEVKVLNSYKNIKKDLELTKKAFYLAELVNKTIQEGVDSSEIYVLFGKALDRLEVGEDIDLVVSKFELTLLKKLGYGTDVKRFRGMKLKDFKSSVNGHVSETLEERFKSLEI